MKMKLLLALATTLVAFSAFSADEVVIPKEVLDIHKVACPDFGSPDMGEGMMKEVHTIPGTENSPPAKTLVILGCQMYAYNTQERAYILDSYGEVTALSIAEVSKKGDITATLSLMGSSFNAKTNVLNTYSKGRGLGDCGSSATYKLDKTSLQLVLIEARLKEKCDGKNTAWPVTYKKIK